MVPNLFENNLSMIYHIQKDSWSLEGKKPETELSPKKCFNPITKYDIYEYTNDNSDWHLEIDQELDQEFQALQTQYYRCHDQQHVVF